MFTKFFFYMFYMNICNHSYNQCCFELHTQNFCHLLVHNIFNYGIMLCVLSYWNNKDIVFVKMLYLSMNTQLQMHGERYSFMKNYEASWNTYSIFWHYKCKLFEYISRIIQNITSLASNQLFPTERTHHIEIKKIKIKFYFSHQNIWIWYQFQPMIVFNFNCSF